MEWNRGKEAILSVEIRSLLKKSPPTKTTDKTLVQVSEEFCFESCSVPRVTAKERGVRGAAGCGHPAPLAADVPSRKFRCLGLTPGFQ